jgi:hypothetical protein
MRYGKVFTSFWTNLANLDLQTKAIGAYLLSSPHATMIGCYRLPLAYVMDDLRSGSETVSEGFRKLCETGFIVYDAALSWVLIRRFLIWNPIENPNQGKSAAKLVAEVPKESSVYAPLIDILRLNAAHFPDGFVNSLETVPQGFQNQYPYPYPQLNPEQEETSPSAQAGSPAESLSERHSPQAKSSGSLEKAAITRLFELYCTAVSRNPCRYTLTAMREKKALMRLQERRRVRGGDLVVAERDLAQAIENLAASEWHRAQGHIDWLDQIFRSAEEFERRLNWTKPAGDSNGNGNQFESRNELIRRKTLESLDCEPTHYNGGPAQGQAAG